MWLIKKFYALFLTSIELIAGIDSAKKIGTLLRFHKRLNLSNPQSLSDYVSYIELHKQSPLASICTDKFAVREYVLSKGFGNILIPVVGGPWKNSQEIDFSKLPNSFVIKATHGCKMNYIVKNKAELNESNCRKQLSKWLKITYGSYSVEPHYRNIPHRLYAESFIDDIDELIDYKIHCINGTPEFILVCSERRSEVDLPMTVTLDLFDINWNHIPEIKTIGNEIAGRGRIKKPKCLKEMLSVAEVLSQDFEFVRIDLYEVGNSILFGEMTFSPACCVFPYLSARFDNEMGLKFIQG